MPSFVTPNKSPARLALTDEHLKRNPSPYYYADLLKKEEEEAGEKALTLFNKKSNNKNSHLYRKSNSLDTPTTDKNDIGCSRRYSITEAGVRIIRSTGSLSSTTSENSDCSECKKRRDWHAQELAKVRATCNVKVNEDVLGPEQCDDDELFIPRVLSTVETTSESILLNNDDMNGTRQIYETAFDSKVAPTGNNLDEVDVLVRNSHLFPVETENVMMTACQRTKRSESKKSKNSKNQAKQEANQTLSQELSNLYLTESAATESSSQLPSLGFTPTPPSTAPLPLKFPLKHERFFINSIKSAPNLPSSNPAVHPRLQSLRLSITENSGTSEHQLTSYNSHVKIERPRSVNEANKLGEIKRTHRPKVKGKNFSSTESITSSAGSMDSLRSSTSEGNRSTTSTESSRQSSSSLASHDSDSGAHLYPLKTQVTVHTKLHILSPISDKSSQEPASEALDAMEATGKTLTLKQTPDEAKNDDTDTARQRKKLFPNKTLLGITSNYSYRVT